MFVSNDIAVYVRKLKLIDILRQMPCTHDAKTVLEYVHKDRNELQMVFEFSLVDLDLSRGESYKPLKWELWELKKIIADWATGLYDGGWAAFYLEKSVCYSHIYIQIFFINISV